MKFLVISAIAIALSVGLAWAVAGESVRLGGIPLVVVLVIGAFAIQAAGYAHALATRTERFFDLVGSLTFISLTITGLVIAGAGSPVGWILAAMVLVWAGRLGTFLFRRVLRSGGDDRFDEILKNPARLFLTWTLQGTWVSLTALAAWIGIASTGGDSFHLFSLAGILVWLAGFTIEAVADRQKSAFRARTSGRKEFISEGLWAWSRHPNYFGEIVLWTGVLLTAAPYLRGWQWLAVISPLFVTLLLTRVSGIPLLEKKAEATWGGRADYEAYKRTTPVLIPRPPRE